MTLFLSNLALFQRTITQYRAKKLVLNNVMASVASSSLQYLLDCRALRARNDNHTQTILTDYPLEVDSGFLFRSIKFVVDRHQILRLSHHR